MQGPRLRLRGQRVQNGEVADAQTAAWEKGRSVIRKGRREKLEANHQVLCNLG